MIRYIRKKITFPAADGNATLDGELMHHPDKKPESCAIVCHPHPGYGGSMHNVIVSALARLLCDAGFASLRFNFRSVGMPVEVCGKTGETEDIKGAVEFAKSGGYEKFILVGYSFGAYMSYKACAGGLSPDRLILVAMPTVSEFVDPADFHSEHLEVPTLIVTGESDVFSDIGFLTERFTSSSHITCKTIRDCDHFFGTPQAFTDLADSVNAFMRLELQDPKTI